MKPAFGVSDVASVFQVMLVKSVMQLFECVLQVLVSGAGTSFDFFRTWGDTCVWG